jgi:hypothetical protein
MDMYRNIGTTGTNNFDFVVVNIFDDSKIDNVQFIEKKSDHHIISIEPDTFLPSKKMRKLSHNNTSIKIYIFIMGMIFAFLLWFVQ